MPHDVYDLCGMSFIKPLMGMRFVLGWVEGVALASVVYTATKLGGETGGDDWVEGESR